MDILPELQKQEMCISCAYLCRLDGYTYREVVNTSRREIIKSNWAKSLCPQLRCYKHHLSEIYNSFTESEAKEDMKKVSQAVCPGKDWHLHQDGVTPEVSYQYEQQGMSMRIAKQGVFWSRLAFWAVIISIFLGVIYFIISYFASS